MTDTVIMQTRSLLKIFFVKRDRYHWNNYLDHEIKITPTDAAMMMLLVKVARLVHAYKDDSFIDICGYAALAGEMSRADVKRPDWG